MIHDARVEVTCDAPDCRTSEEMELRATAGGGYYRSDSSIENSLARHYGWVCRDGKHYCSSECAPKGENS